MLSDLCFFSIIRCLLSPWVWQERWIKRLENLQEMSKKNDQTFPIWHLELCLGKEHDYLEFLAPERRCPQGCVSSAPRHPITTSWCRSALQERSCASYGLRLLGRCGDPGGGTPGHQEWRKSHLWNGKSDACCSWWSDRRLARLIPLEHNLCDISDFLTKRGRNPTAARPSVVDAMIPPDDVWQVYVMGRQHGLHGSMMSLQREGSRLQDVQPPTSWAKHLLIAKYIIHEAACVWSLCMKSM